MKIKPINKKGQADFLFITIFILTLALLILFVRYTSGAIVTYLIDETPLGDVSVVVDVLETQNTITASFDYVFMSIFVILIVAMLISAAYISVDKVFIPVFIILFGMDLLIGVIMNYVYEQFQYNADLASSATTFSMMNFVIDHYISFLIAAGVLSMILYFGKTSSGQGQRV